MIMSRYFITGGLGVVGSNFALTMLKAGHNVTIIDSALEPRNIWTKERLKKQFGDHVNVRIERMEVADLTEIFEHDFVLHAAAHTGIPHSTQDPTDDWISNVDATRHLLETLRGRIGWKPPTVALSSVKPYRVHDMRIKMVGKRYVWCDESLRGINESWPLEPDEPYAASKLAQSGLCMAYARTYNVPVTTLRCSNLYGPAPCHGPRHGWLTWLCISAVLNRQIEIQGTGHQVRDMLYTDDVTNAVLRAFENIDRTAGNVYNVGGGGGLSTSVLEAIDMISKHETVSVRYGPSRNNEDPIFMTDSEKFWKATGWLPKIAVPTGILLTVQFAREHREALEKMYGEV